ncbi:Beta-galactosidase-1-like protein 2 [Microtus ochrogaster]|uniref:Beta-galactosidase n=1 Tax=Microtus ochrogaster TaxID=79684 RepID=A0A8J6GUC0_MICOH|nr:Beta-galactosidase-1-like protein 2 [Microtus ochrogaster]
MPKWSLRRRPGRTLGLVLLLFLSFLVLRRLNWSTLLPLWLQHRRLGLRTKGPDFMLEDSTFQIFGGSIHYFRVPREYWRDRLLKMKACGLNTLTTAFIKLAAKIGLWVILRPGPYICSEIDLGGLPSWLLQDPNMKLRTTYRGFTKAVDLYFDHLMSRVVPLQYKYGGPIIAVQVENEYGSYNKDRAYMPYIKKALEDRGIIEMLLTSDNKDGLQKGVVDGVLATINLQSQQELKELNSILLSIQGIQPKMVMEYWTGWFDSWGGSHNILDSSEVLQTVSAIIKAGSSINLYMFHGGTNFGFINGAMHFNDYKADVTSYGKYPNWFFLFLPSVYRIDSFDGESFRKSFYYDAVLTEAGDYTAKYTKLRNLFGTFSGIPPPPPPELTLKMIYEPMRPSFYLSLWDAILLLDDPVQSETPINMENLPVNNGNGQAFGYILYETTIFSSGVLSGLVRDRGQGHTMLRILVENRGRVNYGDNIDTQRKGLIGNLYLDNNPLKNFKIYSLDMTKSFLQRLIMDKWSFIPKEPSFPAFFLGALSVGIYPSDTFLKLEGWVKGVVFVNDQNLGRYWNIGPQETLYLPGVWLEKGLNKVIIFEETMAGSVVQSTDTPYLGRNQYVN